MNGNARCDLRVCLNYETFKCNNQKQINCIIKIFYCNYSYYNDLNKYISFEVVK